jgi:CheY-like chemotaxis protein
MVNILLVEDDKVDIMNVQRAFEKNSIANPLTVANNGIEALAMLRGTDGFEKIDPLPKIILLDLNMPKMNGLEFLKEIRHDEELKRISVFVMTTSNEDKDKLHAFQQNVAGYIVKPVSFEKFTSAVAVLNNYWRLCELPN